MDQYAAIFVITLTRSPWKRFPSCSHEKRSDHEITDRKICEVRPDQARSLNQQLLNAHGFHYFLRRFQQTTGSLSFGIRQDGENLPESPMQLSMAPGESKRYIEGVL